MNIIEVECLAFFRYVTDRVGPQGPARPPKRVIILDDDENPHFTVKRLTVIGEKC